MIIICGVDRKVCNGWCMNDVRWDGEYFDEKQDFL